jgi:Na+/H+ antiporter NhaD/arsenite permease-like protein
MLSSLRIFRNDVNFKGRIYLKTLINIIKQEMMLSISLIAAIIALFITPPSAELFKSLDWRTLGVLFMMLLVLEGFKRENVLDPIVKLASRFNTMPKLSLFLIFGVFFTSMFVTNDVSLIIIVPLTILLFKQGNKEEYILPVISMENIAAIRGSLLTPFGSPQNLFLYGQIDVSVWHFSLHMLPLCASSAVLLIIFVLILYRKNLKEKIDCSHKNNGEGASGLKKKASYIALFLVVLLVIITRTTYWPYAILIVMAGILFTDRSIFKKVDYVLILTFLCFFIFSSSIAANAKIAEFLKSTVSNNEYWWSIALSQLISNVPSTIVLYPFTENFSALIYGADTAGLVSLIGSLASVINYRIYVREYPGKGKAFIKTFTLISWAFFIIVVIPGFLLSKWKFY